MYVSMLSRYEESMSMAVRPTAAAATRILGGDLTPNLINKTPNVAKPVAGEVMRALEGYKNAVSEVSAGSQAGGVLACIQSVGPQLQL